MASWGYGDTNKPILKLIEILQDSTILP